MRPLLLGLLAGLVGLALVVPVAQAEQPAVKPDVVGPPPPPGPLGAVPDDECEGAGLWGSVEALLWWVRGQPLPPLATSSTASGATAGVLGQRGTSLVLGNSRANSDLTPGVRLTAGGWLDDEARTGLQGSLFGLDRQVTTQVADTAGTQRLFRPFLDLSTLRPSAVPVAVPGTVTVQATSSGLRGADLVVFRNLSPLNGQGPLGGLGVDVSAGYVFLNLDEGLAVRADVPPSTPRGRPGAALDLVATRSQFQGGQVGVAAAWRWRQLTVQGELTTALGVTEGSALVEGATTTTGTVPGALLGQPANSGVHHQSRFSVVERLGLKASWQLNPWLRTTLGFDGLWWTGVVRPGDQVNLAVNPAAANPARTALPFAFRNSDLWVQGLNLGLEVNY
jgi:hypothetical protein